MVGMHRTSTRIVIAACLMAGVAGCQTKTQTGLLVGGAGGAAAGAAIGSASGNAGKGALIGGAIGLIGGGLVGHSMDKADEKEAAERRAQEQRATRAYAADRRPVSAAVSRDEIVTWTRNGTSEEVIIDRIDRSQSVFHLTAADENGLRDQGVSENVILAMKDTARR